MNEKPTPEQPVVKNQIQTLSMPFAIVIAGGLIDGAVFFGLKDNPPPTPVAQAPKAQVAEQDNG